MRRLVRRAEAIGATALAVTVDAPTLGRRERDLRNRFKLRKGLRLANVDDKEHASAGAPVAAAALLVSTAASVSGSSTTSGLTPHPIL